MKTRKEIEDRILQIISYIDYNKTLSPILWSIKLFSIEELLQLNNFLEKEDYNSMYKLLDKNIKELLEVKERINKELISEKMISIKKREIKERKIEQVSLENILVF